MISVFHGLIKLNCLAYLDDVIVFSKRRIQHVDNLRTVLSCIRAASFKLKTTKCKLFCD